MVYTIFVPVILKEDKLQKINPLLALIKSKIGNPKKVIIGIYSETLSDENLLSELKLFDSCEVFVYTNNSFSCYEGPYIEAVAKSIDEIKPQMVLALSSEFTKSVLARVAAKFSSGFVADCIDIKFDESSGKFVFIKPAYGSSINAKISVKDCAITFVTIKPRGGIECLCQVKKEFEIVKKTIEIQEKSGQISFIEKIVREDIDNRLESAKIVIGVGRGIKDKENLKYAYELANILGGAVGVTRPLVDLGWAPKELQIGQSGKIISPDIYFAFGISGAAHHMCGIGKPKLLIAVNKNKDAEIFKIANYGIVADATQTMKSFIRVFKERLENC
ncbi:electron transfer flavoprotein subunit alpha/FixB family protein [Caldicellulosiruptor naganoensis]|uniref:Electron transfer flavoprotein subunit alpha/FixB family protein n=1 Tax=Caldicellulosiruptor naganoensis TaxID=29324 RepID=A0ABY7BHA2_9FIRM|nr:electron transfer flavoprotein subunit alpha/FixB family protein [Caldicellulosiruptor naganoensis]WAM30729.1 electron transfer flavoprotein subunit alpha/FixB family protein [Caldicellulosiruptor naganoensis]